MMKSVMRLQKNQVVASSKFTTPGAGVWRRDVAIMAGYRLFELMCVGGAGGKSGNSTGNTDNIAYGAGGGGGGGLHVFGELVDLPAGQIAYTVGDKGANGGNTGNNVTAGAGGAGGASTFGPYTANGGGGAVGGKARVNTDGTTNSIVSSTGGAGGGNSLGVGTGGVGGSAADTPSGAAVVATKGTWVYDGVDGNGGGKGGGGGQGEVKVWFGTDAVEQAGMSGSDSLDTSYVAPGIAPASNQGGYGGGVNVRPGTGGAVEYYGSGNSGAVIINLT